ncbi:MAG: asparagine synthase (glutamine-hydrolyzing) [Rhodospirillales bacterium]|nr:asparagine synthase (glutamine-hydrolyzing) [Rhodospirillales bacterium]
MCGIFAWLTRKDASPPVIEQARNAVRELTHRGPDGDGEWQADRVYLGHRRLRVIDLSSEADQPFVTTDGALVISYNGEIYNYLELAEELKREGVVFRTESDTEVFAAAYAQWGTGAFARFDGMFAAAIFDTRARRLVLVRDPMGQKPLYYHHAADGIVCASELRGLLALDAFRWTINNKAVTRFLANACFMGEETPLESVSKVPPGHFIIAEPDKGTFEVKRYWSSYPGDDVLDIGEEEAVQEFDRLFETASARTLRADVPVGVFLSGGLDSSLAAAYARHHAPNIRSYTLAMKERDFDESAKAEAAARWAGISQHRVFEMDGKAAIDTVGRHFDTCDEPHGDPGFVNTLLLAQKVRPEIVVGVAGDGADELFWGYETFRAIGPDRIASRLPTPLLSVAGNIIRAFLPASDQYLDMGYKLGSFLGGYPSSKETRSAAWLSAKRPGELAALCPGVDDDFFRHESGGDHLFGPFEKTQAQMPGGSMADRLAFHYQRHFLPDFVATHTDRAAMQESLEVRSPFLSPEIISFANRLPQRLKQQGSVLKVLLRRVLERQGFPPDLVGQKKQGFTFPVARALKTDLNPLMTELLGREELYDGLISRDETQSLVSQHMAGTRNNYRILFNLMALAAWRRKYPRVASGGTQ